MSEKNTAVVPTGHKSLIAKFADKYTIEQGKLLSILKATAFKQSGTEVVTDEEMAALLVVADQYGLNPFTKEIFAFKDKFKGIVPVVSVDGWARIINEQGQLDGIDFEHGEEVDAKHGGRKAFKSLTCIIRRKDRAHPIKVTEYLDEVYQDPRGQNATHGPWQSHPKRMHRHKALIQCARVAFGFGGIYDEDEAERIIEKEINPVEGLKTVDGPVGLDAGATTKAPAGGPAVIENETGEILNKNGPTIASVTKEIEEAKAPANLKAVLDRIMTLPPSKERDKVMQLWNGKTLALRKAAEAPKAEQKKEEPKKPDAKPAAAPAGDPTKQPEGTPAIRDEFKAKFAAAETIDALDDAAVEANLYDWTEALRGELNVAYSEKVKTFQ